jgi:hypothetical protein
MLSRPVSLDIKPHQGPTTTFMLLSDERTGLSLTLVIVNSTCHVYLQFDTSEFFIKLSKVSLLVDTYYIQFYMQIYYMYNVYKASVSLGLAEQIIPYLM